MAASTSVSNTTQKVPVNPPKEKLPPDKNSRGANAPPANDPPENSISQRKLFWGKRPSTGT